MTDIYNRINSGEFLPALPYPGRPKEPAILRKSVNQLSDAEIATISEVRASYAADKATYDEQLAEYRADAAKRIATFVSELHAYHGMTGHPKADKLYQKAYELGHSAGFSEIASYYDDLVELVK